MKCEEKLSMSDEYEDFFFFCQQALHSSQGEREDEAADADPERDNSQGRDYREMRAEREREVTPNSPTVRVFSNEKARNREKRELEREASALRGLLQNLLNHYNARNPKPSLAAGTTSHPHTSKLPPRRLPTQRAFFRSHQRDMTSFFVFRAARRVLTLACSRSGRRQC
jgi:hypothetical protein